MCRMRRCSVSSVQRWNALLKGASRTRSTGSCKHFRRRILTSPSIDWSWMWVRSTSMTSRRRWPQRCRNPCSLIWPDWSDRVPSACMNAPATNPAEIGYCAISFNTEACHGGPPETNALTRCLCCPCYAGQRTKSKTLFFTPFAILKDPEDCCIFLTLRHS